MSVTLVERVKKHVIDDGGFFPDHTVRYHRWSDQDLNGSAEVILFRNPGISVNSDFITQFVDIQIHLLCSPSKVRQSDKDFLALLQYIRANFTSESVFTMFPVGVYDGPTYLQNDRALFEMVVRCGVTDH